MPNADDWINAVHNSHDRFTSLVGPLDAGELTEPSYASEWSIADVASHLGSQAEIFTLFLDAALAQAPVPGNEIFPAIWDRWNALPPTEQATSSISADKALVAKLEAISPERRAAFSMSMFGRDVDLAGFVGMRLGEHALHTWDIAVALDPNATVAPDAVDLLIDAVASTAARAGKPAEEIDPISIQTSSPDRRFVLTAAPEVSLTTDDGNRDEPAFEISAEAFVRLVYGRLDPDHSAPEIAADPRLPKLISVFPGF